MPRVHITLQAKGGVGKSFIAGLLAQWKATTGPPPLCIDTDPLNTTFGAFQALHVRRLPILSGEEIDPRSFDFLVQWISESKDDIVVDTGASAFVALAHYLISNQVPALLEHLGFQLVVHTVITGGQAQDDTLSGFSQLVRQFPPSARFVVWLNPYWGPIAHEGKSFEHLKAYTALKDRVAAIVTLPTLKPETYGRDLREMLQARLTFAEALGLDSLTLMTRQRLKIVRDQIFGQLELASPLL